MTGIRYIDSHAHLVGREREEGKWARTHLPRAAESGITVITIAQVPRLWEPTLKLTAEFDNVFAVLGISHPNDSKLESFEKLIKVVQDEPRVVGIGETGLDYRQGRPSDLADRKDQLREHIHIAREINLPLVIHDGKATEDILKILEEEAAPEVGGMIHFFTGTPKQAEQAIQMGFYLSFGGPHTYAKALADLVRKVPIEYLLAETDSPMLAPPKPHRKEENNPNFIIDVVKGIAEIRGVEPEVIRKATTENAAKLFRLEE
ncbi:TatD family hydrolase [candidate division WOR-3 bacterium]|nr:TatD family hydrolase [candidate division WOR-3 bacterium]